MFETLITTIQSMIEAPNEQLQKLKHIFSYQMIPKNDYFIKAGQISDRIGFNINGLFRYFYVDVNGHEFTKYFCTEEHFIVSYSAMLLKSDSNYSIEALEDSEILVADCRAFNQLFDDDPCWQMLARKLLEESFIFNERREKELFLDSVEERYLNFLKEYPGLENRIKQYHIASYLGVTPVALSRIRARIQKINHG